MSKLFQFFGGRKTFIALFLLVVVSVFFIINKCSFQEWSDLTMWLFGIYAVGNGVEHISTGMKKK